MSGPPPIVTLEDRLLKAFRLLIRGEFPRLTFLGLYEYAVRNAATNTADMDPVDTTLGLPSLVGVPLRFPFSSATLDASNGAKAIVGFINGDPSRPMVLSGDLVSKLSIAGGGPAVGRVGDTVTVTINSGAAGGLTAPPSGGPCTLTGGNITLSGTIQTGSPKVTSG